MAKKVSSRTSDKQSHPRSPGRRNSSMPSVGVGRNALVSTTAGEIDSTTAGNTVSPQLASSLNGDVHWTTAEMQSARPALMPQLQGDGSPGNALQRFAANEGAPESGEPTQEGMSDPGQLPKGRNALGEETLSSGGYEYPAPYTRYNVLAPCYQLYPYCCIGKLFFKQRGIPYVGTAFSIGNNAIFTAGHCIHPGDGDPNGWSTDIVFVPGYNNGETPFGQWQASYATARPDWYQTGNLSEDFGGAVLLKEGGSRICDKVGSLGFAWQKAREQHWHAIGYPSQTPFGGAAMVTTQAAYGYDGLVGPVPSVAIGCDMTPGCSGGPWILGFGTTNEANGLNSYRQADRPEEICSPYFDDRAKQLKDELVGAEP